MSADFDFASQGLTICAEHHRHSSKTREVVDLQKSAKAAIMPPRKRAASQEVDGNFQPQRATGGRGNNAAGHGGRGGRGRSGEVGGSTSRVRGPPGETTLIKSLPAALRSE